MGHETGRYCRSGGTNVQGNRFTADDLSGHWRLNLLLAGSDVPPVSLAFHNAVEVRLAGTGGKGQIQDIADWSSDFHVFIRHRRPVIGEQRLLLDVMSGAGVEDLDGEMDVTEGVDVDVEYADLPTHESQG